MSQRSLITMGSGGAVVLDGNEAQTWVIAMRSSVAKERIRIKNIAPGALYTLIFHQDDIGGHTFEWPDIVKAATSIDTAAGATSVQNLIGYTGGQLLADLPGAWS